MRGKYHINNFKKKFTTKQERRIDRYTIEPRCNGLLGTEVSMSVKVWIVLCLDEITWPVVRDHCYKKEYRSQCDFFVPVNM